MTIFILYYISSGFVTLLKFIYINVSLTVLFVSCSSDLPLKYFCPRNFTTFHILHYSEILQAMQLRLLPWPDQFKHFSSHLDLYSFNSRYLTHCSNEPLMSYTSSLPRPLYVCIIIKPCRSLKPVWYFNLITNFNFHINLAKINQTSYCVLNAPETCSCSYWTLQSNSRCPIT